MLNNKKGIIFGIANDKSIAYGCAKAMKDAGAQFGITYAGEIMEKRVKPIAEELNADFVLDCNLTNEEQIANVMNKAKEIYGKIDFLIHSVAYASREALASPNVSDISMQDFQEALNISAWTFLAMAKHAKNILNENASLITMTYYGSQKAIPNYGLMGIAKAALEAEVRYLAAELGENNIRVNAISAGAIRTLAASGVKGFRDMQSKAVEKSCIKRTVTADEVGKTATYLTSDLSSGITGQVIYVDLGYSSIG